MTRPTPFVKLALAAALLATVAACGSHPTSTAPATRVSRPTGALSLPAPAIPGKASQAAKGMWFGSLGNDSVNVSLYGGSVQAHWGQNDFSGSAFSNMVSGYIRTA